MPTAIRRADALAARARATAERARRQARRLKAAELFAQDMCSGQVARIATWHLPYSFLHHCGLSVA